MRKMTHFLESVLAGNSDRTFTSLDRTKKARIPLLVGRKTSKNITRYSTNVQEILSYENLKAHPNRVQLQNLAQASMLYAVYTSLGDQHPKVNEVNKAINAYMRGGEIRGINVNRFSEEAEKFVNMTWGELFKTTAPEDVKTINDCATIILDSALNELAENGDLELVDIKIDKAKTASRLFLRAFNANLIHSKQTPLTTADAITEVYSSVKERIRDFYQQRYQSSNRHDYLYTLMNNHSREIQDLCDPANISFEHIKNYIKFIEVDQRPSEDTAIANADYKKARINGKQNFRGKISAYIKEDQQWPDVYHLIINVTHYEGQSNHSESLMLYSHNENALDSHSPNLLAPFIKSSNRVAPLIDEKRALELAEQVERNRQLQLETAERLKEENRVKREHSIDSYLALETVTNPNQLEGTYFEQKAIAQLAVKYIPNLRIDSEKNVWLPLANVAEQNASVDNIEGFQKYLPYKDEISGTNKLFEGIGEGRKNEACAVLGNPKEASVLIECEGVANGLIAIEMANQKGIKAAAICGLDVGNLPYTTGKIIASHPMKPIVNLADNDLFNSEKERRYLRHELAALNITDSPKTRNVGLVRAIEMTNAINLPHITFDFEKDFSSNLIDLQKERKGSDIDDAINFLYEVKTGLGEENAAQSAWQEVSDVLVDKINTSMHYNISPHWSIDKQEQFAWCASVENLDSPTLSDYYHLKEIITNSHDVFEKKYELPYDVYRLESLTNHSPLNDTELEVDNKLAQQFDSSIEEYLDSQPTTQTITERDADSHRCEPIPAIDVGIEHLMPPTIVESTIYVDTKIHSITRKLDNIEKSLTKMSGYEYQTRIDKNMRELDRLLDEKARLIGVSARQLKQTDQLANYYDREEEIQSAIELANRQTNFQPSDEDWEQLEEAERTRTTSRSSYVFDYQLDKPEEESEIEQLAKVDANELLNKVLASFTSEQEQPPLPPSQINSRELEQIYHNQLAEISEELNNSSFGNEDGTLQSHREVVRSIVNELSNIDSQSQGQEIYEKYGFDKYWGQYDGDKAELDAEMADVEISTDTVTDGVAAPAQQEQQLDAVMANVETSTDTVADGAATSTQHEQQLNAEMADVETSTGIVADDLATPTQHEQQLNAEMADVETSTDTVADGTATPTQHEQQLDAEMADVETSTDTVADGTATPTQHEQQLDAEMADVETSTDTVADGTATPTQHEQQLDAEMADVETSTDTVADDLATQAQHEQQLDAEMADVETSTDTVADDLAAPAQHEQQLDAEMADVETSTGTVADDLATQTQHEQQLNAEMADVETSTETVSDGVAAPAQQEQQLDAEMANVETSTDTVADDLAAPAQHEQQLDAEMADVETSTDTVADGMDTFSEENSSSSTDRDVFLNAVKLIAAQNQQTLTTLSTIMEKMMAQQNSLFERQAEMFAQIIQSQQDMMSKILSSQTEINHRLDAMQQHLGLDSTITAKGNAIDNSTATTQPPSKQATDSRQLLMQRFVKNHEDIVTKRALLDELDQQIKNQRVAPKEVAAVINPSGVNPKNSDIPIKQATTVDNKANHYNSVIEHLRSNRASLNDGYKSSSKEVKQLISDAINLKCTPITLSELRTNTVKIKGAVLKVANDIFQDERYPRGFPMSIALAEALKNDTSERVPASAVINIAAALYTEKENPLSRISESLVSGQISTEAYYRECHKQLGTQSFDLKMGEEYNAYLESQKLNKQEPHENRAPISEPIHEI